MLLLKSWQDMKFLKLSYPVFLSPNKSIHSFEHIDQENKMLCSYINNIVPAFRKLFLCISVMSCL